MFEQIKIYANSIIAVALLAGLSYSHYYAWSHGKDDGEAVVQVKFDSYRSNINDQVEKAKNEASIEKQRQEQKYAQAQFDYRDTARNLDIALKRLRDIKTVPRNPSMQVAGSGISTMSTTSPDTSGTDQTTSFGAGTFQSIGDYYEASLRDTAQCKTLIEFVR